MINATLYPSDLTQEGTGLANTLTGTGSADYLFGYGGDDTLVGLLGSDVLSGGDGSDILIGGGGNDLMSGGAGKDIFVWQAGDTGVDRITDFRIDLNGGNSDVLDLSQLLSGESANSASLDDFLSFSFTPTSTTIHVSATAGGAEVQTIVLDGVDLSSADYYGSADAATIIDGMLGDNALKGDVLS